MPISELLMLMLAAAANVAGHGRLATAGSHAGERRCGAEEREKGGGPLLLQLVKQGAQQFRLTGHEAFDHHVKKEGGELLRRAIQRDLPQMLKDLILVCLQLENKSG